MNNKTTCFRYSRPGVSTLAVCVFACLACAGLDGGTEPAVVTPAVPVPTVVSPRFFYLPGPTGVDTARYSKWDTGDTLYVGVDGANLRAEGSTKGEVVTKLRLGEELEILEPAGEPVVLIGRRNVWYHVRMRTGIEGYLFGAIISPVRVSVFKDDEVAHVGVVTFSPGFGPRVRAWAPPDGEIQSLDAEPPERYAAGGTLAARAEGATLVVSTCTDGSCQDVTFGWRNQELQQLDPPPPPK